MNKSKLFILKNPIFEMNKSTFSRNIFTQHFHTTFSHKIFAKQIIHFEKSNFLNEQIQIVHLEKSNF